MKAKTILKLSLLFMILGLISCEKDSSEVVPLDQEETFILKNLELSSESDPLEIPELVYIPCGIPQVFELWSFEGMRYGTVTVYNDNEFLYIQYDILSSLAQEGWGILQTYLFVGKYEDWPYPGVDPGSGWQNDPVIVIEPHTGNPATVVRMVPIAEWMEEYCFVIATKAKLNNPAGANPNPRAFINLNGELSYIWDNEYCLEKCLGTGTIGYWKNHPDAWPVDEITIGDVTYAKNDAIGIMKTPGKGDKTYDLFTQLVAAKLNVLIGNNSECINDGIDTADGWMSMYGPVGNGIKAKSDAWKEIESIHKLLDDYNNGLLCAPHRDD